MSPYNIIGKVLLLLWLYLIPFFISLDGNCFNPKIVLIDKHSFEVSKELKFCTFFRGGLGVFPFNWPILFSREKK